MAVRGRFLVFLVGFLSLTAIGYGQEREGSPEGRSQERARPGDAGESENESDLLASELEVELEPPDPKTEFVVPISEEQGGGQIRGAADEVIRRGDNTIVFLGGVEISYGNLKIQAEQIDFDLPTRIVTAVGDVVLDEGPNRYGASKLVYDLNDRTGTMEEVVASLVPDMYFRAQFLEKTGEGLYVVDHGLFSACEGDVPAWSFRTGKAKINVDGYARASNVTMRAKKLPVFYSPYLLFPVRSKRTSGLLMPSYSHSEIHGDNLGLAWFQTFGPSYDATVQVDLFSEDFLGYGAEFRYHPSQRSRGYVRARFIDDGVAGETQHRIRVEHETSDLPGGMRGFIDFVDFSDIEFFRAFDRDLGRNTRRSWQSKAYVTGAWGPHSMNLRLDQRETLLDNSSQIQRQLPEFEYRLRSVQVGELPLYFQLKGAAHYLSSEKRFDDPTKEKRSTEYARLNLEPQITVPIDTVPWFSVSLRAGARSTWYQKTKILASDQPEDVSTVGLIEGDALSRLVPSVGAEFVGPSFSKVFDRSFGSFEKFKHVIEPRLVYSFADEVEKEDRDRTPRFDEIDTVSDRHTATFSIIHRLIGKPKSIIEEEEGDEVVDGLESEDLAQGDDKDSDVEDTTTAEKVADIEVAETDDTESDNPFNSDRSTGGLRELRAVGTREIMSLELLQSYSFDEEQPLQTLRFKAPAVGEPVPETIFDQSGPISLRYRFNPSRVTSLRADMKYSPLADEVLNYSVSGTLGFDALKRNYIGLSWNRQFFIVDDPVKGIVAGDTSSDQLGVQVGLSAFRDRIRFSGSVNLDLDPNEATATRPAEPDIQRQRYIAEYRGACTSLLLEFRESRRLGFLEGVRQEIRDQQFRIAVSLKHIGRFLDFGFGNNDDSGLRNF